MSKYTRELVRADLRRLVRLALRLSAWSRWRSSRACAFPRRRTASPHGSARPLREIVSQPAFVVAVTAGALGYGVMNLLMTATPLAMGFCGHPYSASATRDRLARDRDVRALLRHGLPDPALRRAAGDARGRGRSMFACAAVALSGQLVAHFWWALVLLGVGWNFMYVGGTTLITDAFPPAEKAKAQGVNEVTVFAVLAVSSFSSGRAREYRGMAHARARDAAAHRRGGRRGAVAAVVRNSPSENGERLIRRGRIMAAMLLDADQCYRALRTHDARFDGRFFVGVAHHARVLPPGVHRAHAAPRATAASSPAPPPRRPHGFRPCLRCRPELAPGLRDGRRQPAPRAVGRGADRGRAPGRRAPARARAWRSASPTGTCAASSRRSSAWRPSNTRRPSACCSPSACSPTPRCR